MGEPKTELMDALTALNTGDSVTIAVVHEGEELELDGYVTDAYHDEPERHGFGYVKGSVHVGVELANSAVEQLQAYDGEWFRNATHSVDIRAKEPRPGKWDDPSVVMWDPEVDDGLVVADHWTDLGELQSVEQRE